MDRIHKRSETSNRNTLSKLENHKLLSLLEANRQQIEVEELYTTSTFANYASKNLGITVTGYQVLTGAKILGLQFPAMKKQGKSGPNGGSQSLKGYHEIKKVVEWLCRNAVGTSTEEEDKLIQLIANRGFDSLAHPSNQ